MSAQRAVLKPKALPEKPTVAIVAPASSAQPARLAAGARAMEARGWRVRWMPHAQGRSAPYFSGTTEERVADLLAAFEDPEVDAVVCTRGGYGCNYLLPLLTDEVLASIAASPKPLLGYSDVTAVQTWLLDRVGLVAFHGPMLAADFYREDGVDERSLRAVLGGGLHAYGAADGLRTLRAGKAGSVAEGVVYGGCLTLLAAGLGTPYAAQPELATEGTLLFVEDVGVKPYQVDRMLRQMWLAGSFAGVTGVVFGEMLDCVSPGAPRELLEEAILHALSDFAGPIAMGLRTGHVSRANVTLPLGTGAVLTVGEGDAELRMMESACAG